MHMTFKILSNGSEIHNSPIRQMINELIQRRLDNDDVTNSTYPFKHISCLLWRESRLYQKCNHRRKFIPRVI